MGYQHPLELQGWAVLGMAAPALLGTAFQGVLIPFPAQGPSLGAGSQPAPALTAPSQGRACLSRALLS